MYFNMEVNKDIYKGATIQSEGEAGWSIFEINILRLNFQEINNFLKGIAWLRFNFVDKKINSKKVK